MLQFSYMLRYKVKCSHNDARQAQQLLQVPPTIVYILVWG